MMPFWRQWRPNVKLNTNICQFQFLSTDTNLITMFRIAWFLTPFSLPRYIFKHVLRSYNPMVPHHSLESLLAVEAKVKWPWGRSILQAWWTWLTTIYRNGGIYKHEGNKPECEFNDNNNKKNINKRKKQYVIRKKIRRNKPEGLNIDAILEAVETQRSSITILDHFNFCPPTPISSPCLKLHEFQVQFLFLDMSSNIFLDPTSL